MKTHVCDYPGCDKSFTRAEHLRRHALNHEQPRNGFICERCSVHFQRPDLLGKLVSHVKNVNFLLLINLARHMMRHDKRDEAAGGPGLGTLQTRKRTRRARDGTIIVRPSQREIRSAARSTISCSSSDPGPIEEDNQRIDEAPISPPVSGTDPTSLSIDENDPFLAPMMPGGPFEPYVEPIPGQFDAADGSFNIGLDGMGDLFGMDTGMDLLLTRAYVILF